MGKQTMFSVYGSSHVGFFGGTIQKTNIPEILQIDCNATDFFKKQTAYPTYLFFNPYDKAQLVITNVGDHKTDVYDAVSGTFIKSGERNSIQFVIAPDAARVLVFVPAGSKIKKENGVLKANGVPINFKN